MINIMVILIIFPVILQTDIYVIMLSIGGQGGYRYTPGTQNLMLVAAKP